MSIEINDHQYTALVKAREHWGAKLWKSRLNTAWETGSYPAALNPYRAELQQVRNATSPSWLQRFKFDA